ncbi:MAG TPA: hypothetical protein VMI54_03520 [Polyangiaceae bacterium]|nr:hypothetical protein [Polyangiaceae bacterium]
MGIDGIGKPPPIGPAGAPLGPTATGPTTTQFEVGGATEVKPAGDLARLERGEIGLDAYLDNKVSEATQHLAGKLSPDQLAFVRQTLRSELASDPVLVELVRRTTGKVLEPASE